VVIEDLLSELLFADEFELFGFDVDSELSGFEDELEPFEFDGELELELLELDEASELLELKLPEPDDASELIDSNEAFELFELNVELESLVSNVNGATDPLVLFALDVSILELLTVVGASEVSSKVSPEFATVTSSACPATPKAVIPKISAVPAINLSFFKCVILILLINFNLSSTPNIIISTLSPQRHRLSHNCNIQSYISQTNHSYLWNINLKNSKFF
jgi:hypothetical protein